MVFDPAGVFADVVLAELLDRLVHQRVVRPEPGLAGPYDPLVGVDAYQQAAVHQEGFDPLDLHRMSPMFLTSVIGARGHLWAGARPVIVSYAKRSEGSRGHNTERTRSFDRLRLTPSKRPIF